MTATRPPTRAVKVFSAERGEFWRGQCAACGASSRDLPFATKKEAEHWTDLHDVLCEAR